MYAMILVYCVLNDDIKEMETAAEAGDADSWLDADIHLHDILFKMAGNERARSIIANLNDQWHRVRIGFVALQGANKTLGLRHPRPSSTPQACGPSCNVD